jgi:hypothetical protein
MLRLDWRGTQRVYGAFDRIVLSASRKSGAVLGSKAQWFSNIRLKTGGNYGRVLVGPFVFVRQLAYVTREFTGHAGLPDVFSPKHVRNKRQGYSAICPIDARVMQGFRAARKFHRKSCDSRAG